MQVCVNCTLPECDELNRGCLIRVAAKSDPKLRVAFSYSRWLETHEDVRAKHRRLEGERRRARGGGETGGDVRLEEAERIARGLLGQLRPTFRNLSNH